MLPVLLMALLALPGAEPITTRHLTVSTSPAKQSVAPGERVALNIDIAPKPSMHVYAPGQPDYIAVSITLDKNAAIKPETPRFPAPEKREVKELGQTQLVYSKPFRVVQDVAVVKATARPGPLTLKGTLKYQACDETICYAPITVPVTWALTIQKAPGK